MAEAAEKVVEEPDVLSMSDDDIAEMSPEQFAASIPETPSETPEEGVEEAPVEEEVAEGQEELEEPSTPDIEAPRDIYNQEGEEAEEEEDDTDSDMEVETEEVESYETSGVDYEKEYKDLFSPFRASGREVTVKSVDDARRLMQMGVDYQHKMRALKPHLRIMKALEKNELLDEEKVNFFIDLDKKNPDAIAKFLKDKGVDPLEVDLDTGESYKPNAYAPSQKEMDLDEVLDTIRETPSFSRTISELGDRWDEQSRTILMDKPALVRVINDQIGAGIYDQIMNVVESERLLGRLEGLHDLAAYKQVGDALKSKGAFSQLGTSPKPKRKHVQDPKVKARKKAASPTRGSNANKGLSPDFNPLALSDEDFEKVATSRYM